MYSPDHNIIEDVEAGIRYHPRNLRYDSFGGERSYLRKLRPYRKYIKGLSIGAQAAIAAYIGKKLSGKS